MIINILGATLSIQYKSHTQLFAFLLVIGILVFVPDGLIAFRGSAVARLWAKFRKPAVEGTTP